MVSKPTADDLGVELQYLDSNLEFVGIPFQLVEGDYRMESGSKYQFFYPGNDGIIYFKEVLSEKICAISTDGIQVYALDFPEDRIYSPAVSPWDGEKPVKHMVEIYREIEFSGLFGLAEELLDPDTWILANYQEGDAIKLLAFDKERQTAKIVGSFKNDLDGVVENLPGIFPVNYHEDEMIISLFPSDIYAGLGTRELANPYVEELVKRMPELEENPVLFIYRKKKQE